MNSRLVSAGLAAAMVIGLGCEARPQSASTSGRRQRQPASAAADETPAAAEETASGPASSSAEAPGAKDPFDAAAKTAGKSPGDSAGPKLEKATFGAGCFWHVEYDFEWLPGVKSAVSGYSGGRVANPSYEMVHEGETGHAEVVQVTYDPAVISYEKLLNVFWHSHDPTQWMRQGPDVGTQYRSVIFYHNEAQRKAALKSYQQLVSERRFRAPIVTQLMPMKAFYRAEEYHQNYYGGKDGDAPRRSSRSRRTAKAAPGRRSDASARGAAARKATAAAKPAEPGATKPGAADGSGAN